MIVFQHAVSGAFLSSCCRFVIFSIHTSFLLPCVFYMRFFAQFLLLFGKNSGLLFFFHFIQYLTRKFSCHFFVLVFLSLFYLLFCPILSSHNPLQHLFPSRSCLFFLFLIHTTFHLLFVFNVHFFGRIFVLFFGMSICPFFRHFVCNSFRFLFFARNSIL